ncbi:hypothetical protein KP509_38G065400 [Ceratopteris richardii]|uniref:Uncharacterized protein n=1 Tax=Ceratopteris richardii TaxID=49495 RepID=A0A8T2Q5A2_CERRI|nr:hypothetical protein KP509_38G065400 [Ceratopteris richardii]
MALKIRWGLVKYDALMKRLQSRHVLACGYFGQGFSHLRDALHVWWDTEKPSEPYGSKAIGSLLYKMAVSDWTMLYECLEVILSERVDCIAALLLKKVKEKAGKHSQPICPFGCDHQSRIKEDELLLDDNVPVFSDMLSSGAYGSDEVKSSVEALIGKSLWGTVCMYWKHYKQWLMLIFEHCGKLNMQVMVEKARSTAWTTTPNLYEKGVICFRSQILLRYGLRRILQSGYSLLTFSDANGWTTEREVDCLQSIHHLLQEVDVRDDTVSSQPFTQTKMRRCFPGRRSSGNQSIHLVEKSKKKIPSF